jgi:hypothetical protein
LFDHPIKTFEYCQTLFRMIFIGAASQAVRQALTQRDNNQRQKPKFSAFGYNPQPNVPPSRPYALDCARWGLGDVMLVPSREGRNPGPYGAVAGRASFQELRRACPEA